MTPANRPPRRRARNKPRARVQAEPLEAGGLALPRSKLCASVGNVLRRRFEAGEVGQDRRGLARVVSPELGDEAASVQASRLLAGQKPVPDQHWDAIAEYVGLTGAELLRAVAEEYERLSE